MTASNKHLELWKQQLGMEFGKANQRLFKMMVWKMATKCGMDKCSHCKQLIEEPDHLSLEHIQPWRGIEGRPARPELFWDLDNIAFSHIWCNSGSPTRGQGNRKYFGVDDYSDSRGDKNYKKIRSRLGMNNRLIDLGYWDCEIKAAISYDLAVMYYRKGCGVINFESCREEYKEYLKDNEYPVSSRKRGRLKPWVEHFYPRILQGLKNQAADPIGKIEAEQELKGGIIKYEHPICKCGSSETFRGMGDKIQDGGEFCAKCGVPFSAWLAELG